MAEVNSFRKTNNCPGCHKDFTYLYTGRGPYRKYCPKCRPRKGAKARRKTGQNAWDFNWGALPYPWKYTKDSGNPTRLIGRHRLVLYSDNLGVFSFGVLLMGKWHNRSSTISTIEANTPNAFSWSETRARSIVDSFETF